ncbi:hypothetical protein ACQPZP_14540 [Spirillospora sp. CA-142024]|uniref:hypothetical protein n=1 Tax=Spirillospora sp. CA-142024 TaxID=3240036 RepID=UPI003D8F39CF
MSEPTATDRLTRIETKLDVLIAQHDRVTADHEQRLRALERARWPLPSLAILVAAASAAASFLT